MNTVFKVGDRVYHWRYGWGDVDYYNEKDSSPVVVQFFKGGRSSFTDAGIFNQGEPPSLSFTYYDLVNGGFSQVRPKPRLPKIEEGDVAYFGTYYHRNYTPYLDEGVEWKIGYFVQVANNKFSFRNSKKDKVCSIGVLLALENPLLNPDTPIYKAEDYI